MTGKRTGKRLAVDVGGTFIDFMLFDAENRTVRIEKVPSAGALEKRFLEGVERLGVDLRDLAMIVHGSTLVINTIVQEKGARVGLITTHGFRDVYELGRGNRAEIYNLFYRPPEPLIPRYLRLEVGERLSADGSVLQPLDETEARAAVQQLKAEGVEGIAIAFLHAYANPQHEQRMAEIVAEEFPEAQVSLSSAVAAEWREFERTSTAVLNAYAQPRVAAYLSKLEGELQQGGFDGVLTIMQSSGGMTSSAIARSTPIRTLESGPAGGVIGASALGSKLNLPNLVAADVGGTTFDIALIVEGEPLEKAETQVNRRPVLQPTVDIVSIGAGGGSIAWLDGEGGLRVGPRSAEANPGPACFGLGGTEPTVTDAQLVLGYLDPNYYLGKRMSLDLAASQQAIRDQIAAPLNLDLMPAAYGIYQLAVMNMTYAIRNITVERGHDPRGFSLACFGGGGGLFAGHLLDELECRQAIVPVNPANFSSWGLLNADYREDLTRMFVRPLAATTPDELGDVLAAMAAEAQQTLDANGIDSSDLTTRYFAEMRYVGQEHTVRVPLLDGDLADGFAALRDRFNALHEQAYAHQMPEKPLEIVRLRLAAVVTESKPDLLPLTTPAGQDARKGQRLVTFSGQGAPVECPVYDRPRLSAGQQLTGPLIVEEWTSTTLVLPGQCLEVDAYGNLIITRQQGEQNHAN